MRDAFVKVSFHVQHHLKGCLFHVFCEKMHNTFVFRWMETNEGDEIDVASVARRYHLISQKLFYRTRVRSLFTLVTNSLTHWLTDSLTHWLLFSKLDWCHPGDWRVEMPTQNLLMVADEDRFGNNLLQISTLRFSKKTKLLFRLWVQGLVKISELKFRQDLQLKFGQFFSADVF